MDKKLQNLLRWSMNKKTPPLQIQVHFTNFCNLNCTFCPTKALVKKLNRKEELTEEKLISLVKEGDNLGVEEWHICGGGEPLFFRNSALKVMRLIKEHGKTGEMITNGTLITSEVSEELVSMGWDKVVFSLDSPVKSINDKIRGKDSFESVINACKMIKEHKIKVSKDKPSMFFHTVICNKNYTQLRESVRLAKKVGCEGVMITPLNIWSKKTEKLKLNKKHFRMLKKSLKEAENEAKKLKISHNFDSFSNMELFKNASKMDHVYMNNDKPKGYVFSPKCYMPWFNMSISANGRVTPCFLLKDKGDNIKEKSLEEIWCGDYFNDIRKRLTEQKISKECARCNAYNVIDNKRLQEEIQKTYAKNPIRNLLKKICLFK